MQPMQPFPILCVCSQVRRELASAIRDITALVGVSSMAAYLASLVQQVNRRVVSSLRQVVSG